MNNENDSNAPIPQPITEEYARKLIQSLHLINGFLFDNVLENEEDARIVIGHILSSIYNRKVEVDTVRSQKAFLAVDTKFHSIRMDAYVKPAEKDDTLKATIFDVEMEDRESDRPDLPKRLRYYSSMHDSKFLRTSTNYRALPYFVSITISSYDPFIAGDMYYEASTTLTTHPKIDYDDGVSHIFLYCNGKPNITNAKHSKKLTEMLRYIVSGEKPSSPNTDIEDINKIVSRVKALPEVTTKYMKQWDREYILQLEAEKETQKRDAIALIEFSQAHGISDVDIAEELSTRYGYDEKTIKDLFKHAKNS